MKNIRVCSDGHVEVLRDMNFLHLVNALKKEITAASMRHSKALKLLMPFGARYLQVVPHLVFFSNTEAVGPLVKELTRRQKDLVQFDPAGFIRMTHDQNVEVALVLMSESWDTVLFPHGIINRDSRIDIFKKREIV